MNALRKPKLTVAEYLEIERTAEFKSEFYDGVMYAMVGASPPHNFIKENLSGELHAQLKGGPCRSLSADQRVRVERTGLYTYPDLLIFCGSPEYSVEDSFCLINPVAVIEILSPSTERFDRGTKFRNYQQIPSLVEYVLVAQDKPVCERYIRQADNSWALVSFVGLDATLIFTSVSAQIPLADIYANVTFPETMLR